MIKALRQLTSVTWDGNLLSKEYRDRLVQRGLAQREFGYNWITTKGLEYLVNLDFIRP